MSSLKKGMIASFFSKFEGKQWHFGIDLKQLTAMLKKKKKLEPVATCCENQEFKESEKRF